MIAERPRAWFVRPTLACALGGWLLSVLTAYGAAPEPMAAHHAGTVPMSVQDLHFGDVLYEFYQGHAFDALTRDLQYSRTDRISKQPADARLLEAGLWLELGFHDEAAARLETLLQAPLSETQRNRARLYLGRIWYHRGYDKEAERVLREMTAVAADDDAERVHLLSNILLRTGRYAAAADLLRGWQGSGEWLGYAQFNLGVALLRDGQLAAGRSFLDALGALRSTNPELLALKDRANLALGFALLEADRPADAKPFFDRVRLKGPYASRSLLGAGWVDAKLGDYPAALTPWLALMERPQVDTAVLEGAVAVPRAFQHLHAEAQAAEYYERSLVMFSQERERIDRAIGRTADPTQFTAILAAAVDDGADAWLAPLVAEPDAPESRYLFPIFAGPDFQQGFKVYRELCFLEKLLGAWNDDVGSAADILTTRREAFDLGTQRIDALLPAVTAPSVAPPSERDLASATLIEAHRRNESLASRLDSLSARRADLLRRLSDLRLAQVHVLQTVATEALDAQRHNLLQYEQQARYNLAVIYDHATTTPSKEPR